MNNEVSEVGYITIGSIIQNVDRFKDRLRSATVLSRVILYLLEENEYSSNDRLAKIMKLQFNQANDTLQRYVELNTIGEKKD